jgi:cleavage and polyadenylation specificity factor subunit 5
MEKDTSVKDRLKRMKRMYETEGVRRTVDGILLVHKHGHPHILLLQIGNTFWKLFVVLDLFRDFARDVLLEET